MPNGLLVETQSSLLSRPILSVFNSNRGRNRVHPSPLRGFSRLTPSQAASSRLFSRQQSNPVPPQSQSRFNTSYKMERTFHSLPPPYSPFIFQLAIVATPGTSFSRASYTHNYYSNTFISFPTEIQPFRILSSTSNTVYILPFPPPPWIFHRRIVNGIKYPCPRWYAVVTVTPWKFP